MSHLPPDACRLDLLLWSVPRCCHDANGGLGSTNAGPMNQYDAKLKDYLLKSYVSNPGVCLE